jgi:hypothetical protein
MKKHWKIKSILTLLLITIFFVGCKKPDLNKMAGGTWNPNLAVPIGVADFGVYDILASKDSNDLVIINQVTGELALNYKGEIGSVNAQTILQLNNHSQNYSLSPTDFGLSATPSFSSTIPSSNTTPINFPMNGSSTLNTVNLESGALGIDINTSLKHNINLTLTFPDIIIGGSPATKIIQMNYGGSIPQLASSSLNLANSTCDFTANGTASNTLRVIVDATINGTGQNIVGNENFDINFNLTNLVFENATGYFDQQTIVNSSDSILIKIFNNASTGVFNITNPKVKLSVENSFGIPVQMNITNLKSINSVTGTTVNISNSNLNNILISAPTSMGNTSTTLIPELNRVNSSGITTLVSSTPKYFNYTVNATTNPTGPALNFIEKNSKLVLKAELELPLEGNAYDFALQDTLPFKFSTDVDIIESILFKIKSSNGFPINFETNLILLDSNDVVLFDLFNTNREVLAAAPVDGSGRVTSRANKITDIKLSKSQIALLKNATKIIITGIAATTQPATTTTVKIFDDYKLSMKLGVQTVLKQNF